MTAHSNCLLSATKHHGDSFDDQIQAPQAEPKFLAIYEHSNRLRSATNDHGDSSNDRIQAPQSEPRFVQSLKPATANTMPST